MDHSAVSKNSQKISIKTAAAQPINQLERIRLGGIDQWIRIRGENANNPILLLIQQGPGLPILNEAKDMARQWRLEEEFVVVYWDQRACGKSFSGTIPAESVTIEQMVADTSELIQALTERFNTPDIYVAGFSMGGSIAALAALQHPALFRAVICVGLDVRFDEAERIAYEFVLEQAEKRGNTGAIRELRRIGPPPHLDSGRFGIRVKWLTNFGGVNRRETYMGLTLKTLRQMVTSGDYTPGDIIGTLRGITFTQDALLPDLAGFDLFERAPELDVPVFILQGRHDYAAPPEITKAYFEALKAPKGKQMIWFEESAHMPQHEEPAKFRQTILGIKRRCEGDGDRRAHH